MSQLKSLRSQLETVNDQFFSLLKKRKSLVHQIQSQKEIKSSYDLNRELELFKSQENTLSGFSQVELYIYSLIIEEQAHSYNESYPRWSFKEHLNTSDPKNHLDGTNPLLLALFDKKSYSLLNIKSEFQIEI
jgi:chorismate mutase